MLSRQHLQIKWPICRQYSPLMRKAVCQKVEFSWKMSHFHSVVDGVCHGKQSCCSWICFLFASGCTPLSWCCLWQSGLRSLTVEISKSWGQMMGSSFSERSIRPGSWDCPCGLPNLSRKRPWKGDVWASGRPVKCPSSHDLTKSTNWFKNQVVWHLYQSLRSQWVDLVWEWT